MTSQLARPRATLARARRITSMSSISRIRAFDVFDVAFASVVIAHVLLTRYCKVEESFSLQATRDALVIGASTPVAGDHVAFPGVVPRSFVPAVVLALMSSPVVFAYRACKRDALTAIGEQVATRVVLGGASVFALARLRRTISLTFGEVTAMCFAILLLCEFHTAFYASRPLMNVFATTLTTPALSSWLEARRTKDANARNTSVRLLTFVAFVLRCDVVLLLAGVGLDMLFTRVISFREAAVVGGVAAVASVAISVAVDSWFWGYWVWPEWSGFYFSAVLNKSVEWGTSPWHWYFTSALPRSLLGAYPLALAAAFVERRARPLMFVAMFYVCLISILAHKELRFIFPVLPLFNMSAATVLARIWNGRRKPEFGRRLIAFATLGMLCVSVALVGVFTAASAVNYPGGVAFHRLHHDAAIAPVPGFVHIDVPAAMTGVSRFGEAPEGRGWTYSKEENIPIEAFQAKEFDYLLNAHERVPGYDVVHVENGYAGLKFDVKAPLRFVKTKPEIYIHRKSAKASGFVKKRGWFA